MPFKIVIISGSQSGAERAALDWSVKHELPRGGWCPGGLTEPLDPAYKLKEAATEKMLEVIDANVRDSEATIVFTLGPKAAGFAQKAGAAARKQKKPILHVHRGILGVSEKIVAFLDKYYVRRLHVTGSTEADEPGLSVWVTSELEKSKVILDRRPE
ncbi:MAG: YpsA SLOG family protein [Prosthecobacter sp.]